MLQTEHHAKRCLPLRTSDVDFASDVHFVNDVTPDGVIGKHHIIATAGSNIIMRSITSLLLKQKHHFITKRTRPHNEIECVSMKFDITMSEARVSALPTFFQEVSFPRI